jgi:hypothetical protein
MTEKTASADDTLAKVRDAMRDGARLDVVRLFLNPNHKWGVHVLAHSTTPSGRDKWTKVVLIIPSDGETVADTLALLGTMAEESAA